MSSKYFNYIDIPKKKTREIFNLLDSSFYPSVFRLARCRNSNQNILNDAYTSCMTNWCGCQFTIVRGSRAQQKILYVVTYASAALNPSLTNIGARITVNRTERLPRNWQILISDGWRRKRKGERGGKSGDLNYCPLADTRYEMKRYNSFTFIFYSAFSLS